MKRGEIWWVRFGSSQGGEIRKERPAIIVSNDSSNRFLNRVQVVPLTSSVDRVFPSEAVVTFAGKPAKAMADQIATVAKERLVNLAGQLPEAELLQVERAIRIQLGLA